MFDHPQSEIRAQRAVAQNILGSFLLYGNVKKIIGLTSLGVLLLVSAACSGNDAAPTRTRVAEAQPTQTPWIIIVPVTVTPGPPTATLEPTTTPNAPEPTAVPPTRTRAPVTRAPTQPPQPTAPPEPPTAEPPTSTPVPSCGQAYQVTTLLDPSPNGVVRDVSSKSGAKETLRFNWEPIAPYELPANIGYRVNIDSGTNREALYISHNAFLKERVVILTQQRTYGLTQGDDQTAKWTVDVIMASGEFNDVGDDVQPPLGTIVVCGPSSPMWTIELHVAG